jgi:catechol 2,3-dioxygenase-like lactoylglutathione lyase family enzyme
MEPAVRGILEAALYVADLERSEAFYTRLFGFERIFGKEDRMRALGVCGRQVLLLFRIGCCTSSLATPGGTIPGHDGRGILHVAFAIDAVELEPWETRLSEAGLAVESRVRWDGGGTSLYFRDPDGHSIELVTPGCWSVY